MKPTLQLRQGQQLTLTPQLRMAIRLLQCRPLRPFRVRAGIAHMRQPAHLLQAVQHCVRAVLAVVREHKDIRHPTGPVMRQPFQQERALVLDAQDGRDLHPARPFIFAGNIPAGGIRPLHPHHASKA